MTNLRHTLMRYGISFAFLGIIGAGTVVCVPKFNLASQLAERKADLQRRIADVRHEIDLIREQKDRFERDRDFIESLARQNRRVFPGEIVFVFDD